MFLTSETTRDSFIGNFPGQPG